MRTVDPNSWFRGLVKREWARKQTDANLETRLRRSFGDALLEYWTHASLRGSLIVDRRCETTCSHVRNFVAASIAICMAAALVTYNVQQMRSRPPLQVNAHSSNSLAELRFPAVALCSNNVISQAALGKYIKFLLSRRTYNGTYGAGSLEKNILHFGAFVSRTMPQVDVLFMNLLQQKDPRFNISDLMYQLSPKCSNLLKTCAWGGSLMNCSELFATRITQLGYCCVFNSRYQPEDIDRPPWALQQVGQSTGLIVMYSENDDDSAYVRRPALGVEVLIFDGDEYPLLETGVTRLYPVQRNASVFFSLSLKQIRASKDLKTYKETWRQCRIKDTRGPRTERTSYAWCLMECRRRTIAALCNCVPFTLMPGEGDVICSPNQLPCLNKHKEKFIYLYPGEDADPGLTEEIQDSLACDCLPDCARSVYSADVSMATFAFSEEQKFFFGLALLPGVTLANTSVLRFFFNSNHQSLFIVEPALRWYESIATIACHWVLLLTCTLITFVELVYMLTIRWVHHFRRRGRLNRQRAEVCRSSTDSETAVRQGRPNKQRIKFYRSSTDSKAEAYVDVARPHLKKRKTGKTNKGGKAPKVSQFFF